MKLYVGINLIGHDASIFYLDPDKNRIFALDTERITRFKHDGTTIKECFYALARDINIDPASVEWIINFSYSNDNDMRRIEYIWERLLAKEIRKVFDLTEIKEQAKIRSMGLQKIFEKSFLKTPKSNNLISLLQSYGSFVQDKYGSFTDNVSNFILNDLNGNNPSNIDKEFKTVINYYDHHASHCIGAFYFSPFDECLSISMDFAGDGYFSKVFICDREDIQELTGSKIIAESIKEYLSIGRIYSHITWYLGFTPNSDEGKVEALAAYGNRNNELYNELMKSVFINDMNEIIIDKEIMPYLRENLDRIKAEIGERDIAAGVQGFLEDIVVEYITKLIRTYKKYNVVLSGGIFANVILNMKIFKETGLKNMYIFPAMNDSGSAPGALIMYLRENKLISYDIFKKSIYDMPYWGTSFSRPEVASSIAGYSDKVQIDDIDNIWPERVAELICQKKVVGIFHGKMEYGPRALGNRSILADARDPETRNILNKVIKGRPHFQPFCPSLLEEDREALFESSYSNKHMTCAFMMRDEFKERLPSGIHIDGTARPQFVENNDNPFFYRILKKVKEITGYSMVVNTSFNKHGRTMVYTPEHAITDFLDSQMDYICIEGYLISKK
jgi:carbamoyltransferase